ncbi:excalibur calcium-binding domain-containing protein [Cellulomonas endophytica]|uniref:excalibur calcium-binding domain-containing protein n=1 Tax=Cellulomonas endophytica TaxID=2494735 RepID=UPI001F0C18D3|nr:excalibur calcium-binding domain-containing protein [Cellulomonas endophytica]
MRRRLTGSAVVGAVLASLVLPAAPASAADRLVRDLIAEIPVADEVTSGYDRDLFAHWVDDDGDGCDTRSEVLQAESLVDVSFSSGCTVGSGRWYSSYDGAERTSASDVDVDHTVALAEAWASGAGAWTASTRRAFANDLGFDGSLVAVTVDVDRSKGDQEPRQWLPPAGAEAACQFLVDWVAVKWRWQLTMDADEKSRIAVWLAKECDDVAVDVDRAAVALEPTVPQQPQQPQQPRWPLVKIVYTSTIFELVTEADGSVSPVPLSFERWDDVYGRQQPTPSPTDFVTYPWSPTVYAVTFWPGGESRWLWTRVTYDEWRTAGSPAPRTSGWIAGSYLYSWGTSDELYVIGEDGSRHKLSYDEWAASGFRPYQELVGRGFAKLSWSGEMAVMSDVSRGQGRPTSYAEWAAELFPAPLAVQRFAGDDFYRYGGTSAIWYAGPTMNRTITAAEWAAAGSPAPRLIGTDPVTPPPSNPTPPPSNPGPSRPPNPGDVKNCDSFRSQAEAQAWFMTYYPYYGDVARLDGDNDRRACDSHRY